MGFQAKSCRRTIFSFLPLSMVVRFKMVAVLLGIGLGLAAGVGKGRMVQKASVVRAFEDLADDDEGRLRNAVLPGRFGQRRYRAGIDFFIRQDAL